MTRLLIAGVPKSGKTTLSMSKEYEGPVYHTDDLIHLPWDEQTKEVVKWMETPGPWVIEGCAVARALREWLRKHPEGLPFDEMLYLAQPHVLLSKNAKNMAKGTDTVWREAMASVYTRQCVDVTYGKTISTVVMESSDVLTKLHDEGSGNT